MKRKNKVIYITIGILLVVFVALINSTSIIIDYKWFKEVGYTEVFWYKFLTELKIFVPLFIILTLVFFGYFSYIRNEYVKYSIRIVEKTKKTAIIAFIISAFMGLVFSASIAGNLWNDILMYGNSTKFNVNDPIFHNDISFYVFKLPLLQKLYAMSFGILVFLAFVTVIFYGIMTAGNLFSNNGHNKLSLNINSQLLKPILNKLSAFVLIFFILSAIGYKIKSYSILTSSFGNVFGAGYTDIKVTKPFYTLLFVVVIITGIVFMVFLRKKKFKLMLYTLIPFIALSICKPIIESAVQNIIVLPNEIDKEKPYIQNNMKYTRMAFGLDKLKEENFNVDNDLTAKDIKNNSNIIDNVRINDYKPAIQVYNQLQGIRPYYDFTDVDVDRYKLNGKETQVFLSAREINPSKIPSSSWINVHLKYTHGYGIVMSPVNSVTKEGQPNLLLKNIPPTSKYKNIAVKKPQIYFGESPEYYVITNTGLKEFDYPSGDNNKETIYNGKAGIPLNLINKLLFTVNQGNMKFLFSQDINSKSKILINRNIMDRVKKIAPFLKYDSDPYIVVSKGRLYWMVDAYTMSNNYPYSQSISVGGQEFNYIRNSVKVTIDAYDGTVKFYIADNSDPIIKTYSKIFKHMFKPIKDMPKDLRNHLRYPQMYFDSQDVIIRKYHVEDTQVFYNNEDAWNRADVDGSNVESHYLYMKLPGEKKMEFSIMLPYTPKNKQNMVAWLCGRMDGNNYGKLVLYKLPKQELIYGPKQIEARINQDTDISKDLTLWGQQGSSVYRGNIFVVPIDKAILYVQPLYINSSGDSSIPELKKVIVVYNDNIIMAGTFKEALNKIFNLNVTNENVNNNQTSVENVSSKETTKQLINTAADAYDNAINAQKNGDWAEYGRQLKVVEQTLKKLKARK